MSKTDGHGIVGLLDQILCTPQADTLQPSRIGPRRGTSPPATAATDAADTPMAPARRGRPPGRAAVTARPKAKVTLRITSTLVASYRDWSWEARSQLSQLVEQALADYYDRQRTRRGSPDRSPRGPAGP